MRRSESPRVVLRSTATTTSTTTTTTTTAPQATSSEKPRRRTNAFQQLLVVRCVQGYMRKGNTTGQSLLAAAKGNQAQRARAAAGKTPLPVTQSTEGTEGPRPLAVPWQPPAPSLAFLAVSPIFREAFQSTPTKGVTPPSVAEVVVKVSYPSLPAGTPLCWSTRTDTDDGSEDSAARHWQTALSAAMSCSRREVVLNAARHEAVSAWHDKACAAYARAIAKRTSASPFFHTSLAPLPLPPRVSLAVAPTMSIRGNRWRHHRDVVPMDAGGDAFLSMQPSHIHAVSCHWQMPLSAVGRSALQSEVRTAELLLRRGIRVGHFTCLLDASSRGAATLPEEQPRQDCLHVFLDGNTGTATSAASLERLTEEEVEACVSQALWWWCGASTHRAQRRRGQPSNAPPPPPQAPFPRLACRPWSSASTRSGGHKVSGSRCTTAASLSSNTGLRDGNSPLVVALYCSHVSARVANAVCSTVAKRGLSLRRLRLLSLSPSPEGNSASALSAESVRTVEELFLDNLSASVLAPSWHVILPHCHLLRRLVVSDEAAAAAAMLSTTTTSATVVDAPTRLHLRRTGLHEHGATATDREGTAVVTTAVATAATTHSEAREQASHAFIQALAGIGSAHAESTSARASSRTAARVASPVLEELCLGNHFSLSDVSALSQCTRLRSLNLSWTDVTDEALRTLLPALPCLEELHLDWCYHLMDVAEVVAHRTVTAAPSAEGLAVLSVAGLVGVNDDTLTALAEHTRDTLQEINLYWCRSLTSVACLARCPRLQQVRLPDDTLLNAGTRGISVPLALHGVVEVAGVVAPFVEQLQWQPGPVRAGAPTGLVPAARTTTTTTTAMAASQDETDGTAFHPPLLSHLSTCLPYLTLVDLSGCGHAMEGSPALTGPCGINSTTLDLTGGAVRSTAVLEALLSHGDPSSDSHPAIPSSGVLFPNGRPRGMSTRQWQRLQERCVTQRSRLERLVLRQCSALSMRQAIPVVAKHTAATLTTLCLARTAADTATLRVLARELPRLTSLDLSHCSAVDDLTPLLAAPSLRKLALMDGTHTLHERLLVWDRGTGVRGLLPMLGKLCPEFRTLRLRGGRSGGLGNMTDADMVLVSSLGRWVTEVDLCGVHEVGPLTIAGLSDPRHNLALACGSLHRINLSFTNLTDAMLATLAGGMRNSLVELRLHGCTALRRVSALEPCRRLRVLKLSGTLVEPHTLFETLWRLPSLVELDIRHCPYITDLTPLTYSYGGGNTQDETRGGGSHEKKRVTRAGTRAASLRSCSSSALGNSTETEEAGLSSAAAATTMVTPATAPRLTTAGHHTPHRRMGSSHVSYRSNGPLSFDTPHSTRGLTATDTDEESAIPPAAGFAAASPRSLVTVRATPRSLHRETESRLWDGTRGGREARGWTDASVSQMDLALFLDHAALDTGTDAGPLDSSLPTTMLPDEKGRSTPCLEAVVSPPPQAPLLPTSSMPSASLSPPTPPPTTSFLFSRAAAAGPHSGCVASRLHRLVFASNTVYLVSTTRAPEMRRSGASGRGGERLPLKHQTLTSLEVEEGMRGLAAVLHVMCPGLLRVSLGRFLCSHACHGDTSRLNVLGTIGGGSSGGGTGHDSKAADAELADMTRLLPGVVVTVGGQRL